MMAVSRVASVAYELTVPLLFRSLGVRTGLRTGAMDEAGALVDCFRRR